MFVGIAEENAPKLGADIPVGLFHISLFLVFSIQGFVADTSLGFLELFILC